VELSQTNNRALPRMQANRDELVDRMLRIVPTDGPSPPLSGLHLYRSAVPLSHVFSVLKPSLCVIAQGSKEVLVGETRYVYDSQHYLISTVELPRISQILEASPDRPYLSLRLELSPDLVSSVITEVAQPSRLDTPKLDSSAMNVSPLEVDLQDAILRLVRLVDTPAEAPVLMPLILREIVYRLLLSQEGPRLQHLIARGSYTPHIVQAVERLRETMAQPLSIESLARELGMSVSGLHHRFKAVTAMSPLQFQKQLRLQEARRLMLSEGLDAAVAAHHVGYQDASHFSREYKSLFGVPPMRHVQQLRGETVNSTD